MSEKEEFSRLSSVKKCPVCGGETEKGYVHGIRGIYWSTKKYLLSSLGYLSAIGSEAIVSMWEPVKHVPGLKCEKCGIVIFDYREIEERRKRDSALRRV